MLHSRSGLGLCDVSPSSTTSLHLLPQLFMDNGQKGLRCDAMHSSLSVDSSRVCVILGVSIVTSIGERNIFAEVNFAISCVMVIVAVALFAGVIANGYTLTLSGTPFLLVLIWRWHESDSG